MARSCPVCSGLHSPGSPCHGSVSGSVSSRPFDIWGEGPDGAGGERDCGPYPFPDDDTILRIASGADDPVRAADICAKAAELVGGERDRTHGSKRENFEKIARLWNAYLRIRPNGADLDDLTELDVGHMMALLKIARTQHGAFNLDDYVDGAGYLGCAAEIAAQLQQQAAGVPPDADTAARRS